MAIEIKELVIKMEVGDKKTAPRKDEVGRLSDNARKQIVQECVEKILKKLESKFDR